MKQTKPLLTEAGGDTAMDKIERYRQFIKQILTEHAQISSNEDAVKSQLIFDNENDHYQLGYVGWPGDKRVFGPVMHFDNSPAISRSSWIAYLCHYWRTLCGIGFLLHLGR